MGGAAAWENVDQTTGKMLVALFEGLTCSTDVFEQAMSVYQGLLSTNADSECRRTDDDFLQMCGMWHSVEGELASES